MTYLILFGRFCFKKCGKIWKNSHSTVVLQQDWGNTAWLAMAGLGTVQP